MCIRIMALEAVVQKYERVIPCDRRRYPERYDSRINDAFLQDYMLGLEAPSNMRLQFKTQAISLPDSPHTYNRLSHVLAVTGLAINMSQLLGYNTHLCMAISINHDMGHVLWGHVGERTLSEIIKEVWGREYEFRHHNFGIVVAQKIDRLNLTYATLQGISNHSVGKGKMSRIPNVPEEDNIVRYADKVTYLLCDFEDALRTNMIKKNQYPRCIVSLGKDIEKRRQTVLNAFVDECQKKGYVEFTDTSVAKNVHHLKEFMYKEVYPKCNNKAQIDSVHRIYEYFLGITKEKKYRAEWGNVDPILVTAMLTDTEATELSERLLKSHKTQPHEIRHFGVFEYLPLFQKEKIDYLNLDMDW